MKIKKIVEGVVIAFFVVFTVIVFLSGIYYVDDTEYCKKHKIANPDISFSWGWSTGCMFELPDGNWVNLREYENRNQYKLDLED